QEDAFALGDEGVVVVEVECRWHAGHAEHAASTGQRLPGSHGGTEGVCRHLRGSGCLEKEHGHGTGQRSTDHAELHGLRVAGLPYAPGRWLERPPARCFIGPMSMLD